DAVAGQPQLRVIGRDLEDRTKDDLGLDAVAVHVAQPQLDIGRAAGALVVDAGTVKGVIDRLHHALVAGAGRDAVPAAPYLAVADPHRHPVALLDMRGAVAQRRGQPRRP